MTYLLKSNTRVRKSKKIFYWSIALLLFTAIFSTSSVRSATSSSLQFVGIPMWKVQNYIYSSQSGFFAYFRSKQSLVRKNEALTKDNQDLVVDNLKTKILQDENEALKTELQRSNKDTRVLASILIWPSKSIYDSLIIDIGIDHGVIVGEYVVANGVYVGKVSEVYTHSSKVILFSSGGQKLEVFLNPSHVSITAYGRGGGNFQAEVPRGIDANIGDVVTVPGISIDIFATVEDIIEKPTDSYKTILFKNPINIETLKWVEVVKN
jgi:rod shape-determining protein MreC